jgi:hypothetical protein
VTPLSLALFHSNGRRVLDLKMLRVEVFDVNEQRTPMFLVPESSSVSISGTFGEGVVDSLHIDISELLMKSDGDQLALFNDTFSPFLTTTPVEAIFPVWTFADFRVSEFQLTLCYTNPASPLFAQERPEQIAIPSIPRANVTLALPALIKSVTEVVEQEVKRRMREAAAGSESDEDSDPATAPKKSHGKFFGLLRPSTKS